MKIADIKVGDNIRLSTTEPPEWMMNSIQKVGIIQPLTIDEDNNLIAGYTRLAAAIKVGLDEVPVHVRDSNGTPVAALQFIENTHRRDLTDWEKAQAALTLNEGGMKQAEIAKTLSVKPKTVSQYVKSARLELDDEVGNQFTLEGLADLADAHKQTKLNAMDLATAITERGERDVHGAVRSVQFDVDEIEIMEELAQLQSEWAELGIEVVHTAPNLTGEKDKYGYPAKSKNVRPLAENDGYFDNTVDVPIVKHINEPCHVIELMPLSGFRHTTWRHWCIDVKRHGKAGKSEVKAKVAPKTGGMSDEEKAERRANKEAKDARRVDAAKWLVGSLGTNRSIYDLAVPEAASNLRAETIRAAVLALIEVGAIEKRPTGAEYGWYSKKLEEYLDKRWGDDEVKRMAFKVKALHAAHYIENPSWATGARLRRILEDE